MFNFIGKKEKDKGAGVAIIAIFAGLSLFFTGCGLSSNAPQETAASETATTPATPSPSATSVKEDKTVIAGELIQTNKGSYRQAKLPEDSPAYNFQPEEVAPEVSSFYAPEDIKAGVKAGIDYIVKDIIDPPVIEGEMDRAVWWNTAKADFDPVFADSFFESLGTVDPETNKSTSGVLENFGLANKEYTDFSYVYSPDETRIKNLKISIDHIYLVNDSGDIGIMTTSSYEIPATYSMSGKVQKAVQSSSGGIDISVIKDASGKWVISGWHNKFSSSLNNVTS